MAAVINIITKKGKGKPSFEIEADVGSWQRLDEKAILQGSTEKFSYFILGSHGEEDGYRDNSNFTSQDYAGKLSYQAAPELELFMKIGVHTHDRKLPGILTKDEIESVGRRGSVTDEDDWKSEQMNIDWGFELTPDEYSRFSLLFYFNNNQSDSLVTSPGAGDSSIDDVEDDFSLSLKYASSYPLLGRQNKAIFGLDLLQEEVDSENLINFPIFSFINEVNTSFKRRSLGIYLHNDFSITNKIILGAGVRYDRAVFDFNSITNDIVTGTTSYIN
jgi:iron complex outermembrane receptor protein